MIREDADRSGETAADPTQENYWLLRAQRAYDSGRSYIESEISESWQRDVSHFRNKHGPGSKFGKADYRNRSKTFRPKTRMSCRSWEAAVGSALFSTQDLIDISPHSQNDPASLAGAALAKRLVQYRLEVSIPWFQTVIGAAQDAYVYGICASYQDWAYHEEVVEYPLMNPINGGPVLNQDGSPAMAQMRKTVLDKPTITPIEPENLLFDPGCDWRDPVGSSTYLVRICRMYLSDVLAKMAEGEFITISEEQIKSYRKPEDRSQMTVFRTNSQTDETDQYDTDPVIYVHQNFVRDGGQEWVYWTLGTTRLLSPPQTLEEFTPLGERPFTVGRCVIESHQPYPMSPAALVAPMQEQVNELVNQRIDNVSLVLNKRYLIRRGRKIDLESLMRNVPGGGVMTEDPAGDVRVMETPDVTSSAYAEQDRLDVQIDEMTGNFSQGSVQLNRKLNETVGGMNLMSQGASAIAELTLRTFVETWVEPTLRQLVKLEQAFETDAMVLAMAGQEAKLERFGVDPNLDELLQAQVRLRVNVGLGATNPQQKIEKLMMGINAVAQMPGAAERLQTNEVIKEVFGALGYENGERFFMSDEQMQAMAAQRQQGPPPELALKEQELQIKLQAFQADQEYRRAQIEQAREKTMAEFSARQAEAQAQTEQAIARMQSEERTTQAELALKRELDMMRMALDKDMTVAQLQTKLQIEAAKSAEHDRLEHDRIQTQRDITALREASRAREMNLKREMGSGI